MSDTNHEHDENCAKYHAHAVPLWGLALVLGILLVLTITTVIASVLEIGELALALALVIAVVKASLVLLFFMHLWWDSKFNSLAVVMSVAFVVLFIGLAILDTAEYRQNIVEYRTVRGIPRIEKDPNAKKDEPKEHKAHEPASGT